MSSGRTALGAIPISIKAITRSAKRAARVRAKAAVHSIAGI
jgi:hypothetical protein